MRVIRIGLLLIAAFAVFWGYNWNKHKNAQIDRAMAFSDSIRKDDSIRVEASRQAMAERRVRDSIASEQAPPITRMRGERSAFDTQPALDNPQHRFPPAYQRGSGYPGRP